MLYACVCEYCCLCFGVISDVCACSTSVILFVCTLFSALFGCVVFVSCSLDLMFSLGGGSVCVYVFVCATVFFLMYRSVLFSFAFLLHCLFVFFRLVVILRVCVIICCLYVWLVKVWV